MTVTIAIFSIVLASITGIYTAGQRYYRASSTQNELWQNVRVVFDRITREVRQSESMATTVTTEQSGAVSTIMFQDGHDTSDVRYIRYRLDGTSIWRDTLVYAFSTTPSTYVSWDALDEFDNPPEETILDEQQVGEYFSDIDFWGENNLIHMEATLEKIDYSIEVMTAVYGRNL
jgi:hypothetical protein